jgi:hypothetical protein
LRARDPEFATEQLSMVDLADDEPMSVWMRPEFIDAIARRVLELGREAGPYSSVDGPELLTVAEVARRLSVSPNWVYAHKRDLGAIRLGDGPKARLRFRLAAVLAELSRQEGPVSTNGNGSGGTRKRGRRRLVSRPLSRMDRASRRA